MRKSIVLAAVVFLAMIVSACGNKGNDSAKQETRQEIKLEAQQEEIRDTAYITSDYSKDYLVYCGEDFKKAIMVELSDVESDPSHFSIGALDKLDFDEMNKIEMKDQWSQVYHEVCTTPEDAIVVKFVPFVRELKEEGYVGNESVALRWLDINWSSINEARLAYKLEKIARLYGYTTKAEVYVDLDTHHVMYNLYIAE